MSPARPKPWCISAPQLRNASASQQQIYKLENAILQRLVGGQRWADWFKPSGYSQLVLQISPAETSQDPMFQDTDPRLTCWYTYFDPSFPVDGDEDDEDDEDDDWFEVTDAELAEIWAAEAEGEDDDDDDDDPVEELYTDAELTAMVILFEVAIRTSIDATGHHLRLGPPPWDEPTPPAKLDDTAAPPPIASDPAPSPSKHSDTNPPPRARLAAEPSLPLSADLIFEVHVPSTENFPHPWVDAIETYIGGLDGANGEESDEPETLEDEYLYFLAGASESQLIEHATRIAKLPGVPSGVYVTVSDADSAMGGGRRIDLRTDNS